MYINARVDWERKQTSCRRRVWESKWWRSELAPLERLTWKQPRHISRALTRDTVCKKTSGEDARGLRRTCFCMFYMISCTCTHVKSHIRERDNASLRADTLASKHKLFHFHSPSLSVSFRVLFSQYSVLPSLLRWRLSLFPWLCVKRLPTPFHHIYTCSLLTVEMSLRTHIHTSMSTKSCTSVVASNHVWERERND